MVPRGLRAGGDGIPEAEAVLRLRQTPGIGDVGLGRLLDRFGTASRALEAPSRRFAAVVGGEAAEARESPEPAREAREALDAALRLGMGVLPRGDTAYPVRLEALHDPPAVLFLLGDQALLESPRTVAIVGSRRASGYGRRVARRLARELAVEGITVVSGMALGVDGEAHYGALDASGSTVAVLGCGADLVHPPSHGSLYRRIRKGGLVLSEFRPGVGARPHNFPRRNRVLAALADAVVVVEAGARSGALITVDHALDVGKEVFAVPGSVERAGSQGTHALLRDGAHLLASARDLLSVMGWGPERGPSGAERPPPRDPDERALWTALGDAPAQVDHLIRASGLAPEKAMAGLSRLELAGRAVQLAGGRFARASS